MTMTTTLDSIVQRLQNMPSFNIHALDPSTGRPVPWFEVTSGVLQDLVIHQANVTDQAAGVSLQIAYWGRLAGLAARVSEVEERLYRIWRDRKCLELSTPDPDDKDWKKPSEAKLEQMYRTHPEYSVVYAQVERAKEAQAATEAILLGFRAKKDMLNANPGRNAF